MDIKPRSSSQSETTVFLKSLCSMEAEDSENTQEKDALYRWPWVRSDPARASKGSVKWFQHGTSSPMVLRALLAKSMSFRAWTQATECRSVPMWTLAALYQKNQGMRDDNAARLEKTFVMGSLRSTWEYIHKYHDNIVDAKCYLKNALLSKC